MTPPPSTVSTVRARRLGVRASKSCGEASHSSGDVELTPAATTHLQDTHTKGAAQDLERFRVVAVADLSGCDEEVEGVILTDIHGSAL